MRIDASTGTVMKPSFYPNDIASDALSALRFLQQHKDIDPKRIGLWGSSEGGMLATYVASKSKDVAFAINSSGFMEPLWQTLSYQVEPVLRDMREPEDVIQRQVDFVHQWLGVARTGKSWKKFKKQRAELIKKDGFTFFQSRGEYKSVE
jgi:acetyl esterase/lipase